ncbi:MAG TPA: T9SS type A sorting domain-containing protein, partial [bacterium]|nr:T9SS type A sorting domain-containing protein [bacterium]
LTEVNTGIAARSDQPDRFILYPAYPNPFNAITTVRFELPKAGSVTMEVFNIRGQKVATLADGYRNAGEHTVRWETTGLASGEYVIRLHLEDRIQTQKVVLQK